MAREKAQGSLTRQERIQENQDIANKAEAKCFENVTDGHISHISGTSTSPKILYIESSIYPTKKSKTEAQAETRRNQSQTARKRGASTLNNLLPPRRLLSHRAREICAYTQQQNCTALDTEIATFSIGSGAESATFSSILTTERAGSAGSGSIDGKVGPGEFPYENEDFEYDNRYIEFEKEDQSEEQSRAAPAIVRGNSNGEASSLGSSGGSANSGKSLLSRTKKVKPRRITVQSEGLKHKGGKNKSVSDSDISHQKRDLTVGLLNKIKVNSDSKINHTRYDNGEIHVRNRSTSCESGVDLCLTSKALDVSRSVTTSVKAEEKEINAAKSYSVTTVVPQNSTDLVCIGEYQHSIAQDVIIDDVGEDSVDSKHSTAIAAAAKAVLQTVSWENVPGPSGEAAKSSIRHAVSASGGLFGASTGSKGKAIVVNGGSGSNSSSHSLYRKDQNGYYNRPYHHRSLENGAAHGGSGHPEKSSFWKELPEYQLSNYHQTHKQRLDSNGSDRSTPVATASSEAGGQHYHKSRYHHYYQDARRRGNSDVKIQDIVKNGIEIFPPGLDSRSATPRLIRDHSPIWVTRTSRPGAVADLERQAPPRPAGGASAFVPVRGSHTTLGDDDEDEEWAERVSLSDASDYHYPGPTRQSPRLGTTAAGNRTASGAVGRRGAGSAPPGKRKPGGPDVRGSRRGMMSRPGRRGCCKIIHLKEDNARFILLAVVMVVYMLTGAALFTVLERDNEETEKRVYEEYVEKFKLKYPQVNVSDLEYLLDMHSKAETAGYVGDRRPRWDFPGSFYFVGTVVSTIGKSTLAFSIISLTSNFKSIHSSSLFSLLFYKTCTFGIFAKVLLLSFCRFIVECIIGMKENWYLYTDSFFIFKKSLAWYLNKVISFFVK